MKHTSFFVTGLSAKTKCVSLSNPLSVSKSANSAKLFDASTRFVRFGTAFGRLAWMLAMRFLAKRRVVMRGDRGKLPRICISLSVKSMESCGCCSC